MSWSWRKRMMQLVITAALLSIGIPGLTRSTIRAIAARGAELVGRHIVTFDTKQSQRSQRQPSYSQASSGSNAPVSCEAFFSPDSNLETVLCTLIGKSSWQEISVASYLITNKRIADALCVAAQRGVAVTIVCDAAALKEANNRIAQLMDAGVRVYVFDGKAKNKARGGLMHNKFIIMREQTGDTEVWTGSCNFTVAGTTVNQENGILIRSAPVAEAFIQQYRQLKERSLLVQGSRDTV